MYQNACHPHEPLVLRRGTQGFCRQRRIGRECHQHCRKCIKNGRISQVGRKFKFEKMTLMCDHRFRSPRIAKPRSGDIMP